MKLKGYGWRRVALVGGLVAAALMASCGGGEQVQAFRAERVLSFGDETSYLDASGRKYTVNALLANSVSIDCTTNPIWVQYLASAYGLVFPQCNPNGVVSPASLIYAAPNATVADLPAQIDQQVNQGGFSSTDLVTILMGQNDLLALYAQYPGVGQDELTANVQLLGIALATQVNRVADLGGKVLIATVPDLGVTPFGLREEAINPGRAAVLTALTLAFNSSMRANIENDGHKIGLVLLDERIDLLATSPSSFGFFNVIGAACSAVLPNCTTSTLVADPSAISGVADGATWLWADDTHLSAGGHNSLGQLAAQRAAGNPF